MRTLVCFALVFAFSLSASAQNFADTVLRNGRFLSLDSTISDAIAIRDKRIQALGKSQDIEAFIGPRTKVIDVREHTVIPGLIDSHIHAIRAGLTEDTEVSWAGVKSLATAIELLVRAAKTRPRGTWLIVAGGWTEAQFTEKRRPSLQEIEKAIPHHHVYIQKSYASVLISSKGVSQLGLHNQAGLASRLTADIDKNGAPTDWINGTARTISDVYNLLPRPSLYQQVHGTKKFFKKLASYGITGVVDPGGYNLPLEAYKPLFQIWKYGQLKLRVNFSISAPARNAELTDFQTILKNQNFTAPHDGMLTFNGIGENVAWGMYNNESPSALDQAHLKEVLVWAAQQKLTATFHWNTNETVHMLLDVIEAVHQITPISSLRWSIAHLNNASVESLQRMQALHMGWLVQNASHFEHGRFLDKYGAQESLKIPPIATAMKLGLHIGAGTDAHRVMSYNPFVSLQWFIDGKTVDGQDTRAPTELISRMDALKLYTQGSAWFAHADKDRGDLQVGMLADLAVLDKDFLTIPTQDISSIRSHLTMVDGKVVYTSGVLGR